MCTSFRVNALDKSVAVGRTMEFPNLLGAKITVLPRGFEGTGTAPGGAGKTWTSEFGVVGVDAFGQPGWLTDGMNEKGLYAGLLYMPDFCDYESTEGKSDSECMAIVDTIAYLLGTCSTIAEAKEAMASVVVWEFVIKAFGFAPPAHLVLHDATGQSAVLEWRGGEPVFFDNPIGVATNSPHLDWHLTNLRNYVNLSPQNPKAQQVQGVTIAPLGQGPGMSGLPADTSAPSRFVRATAYTASLLPVAAVGDLDTSVLHVLNNFDIPFGSVREGDDPNNDDHTLWTTVSNLTARTYSIRSYDNPIPQRIDLNTTDFAAGPARQIPLPTGDFASLAV